MKAFQLKNIQCKLYSNDLHWLFIARWDINHFQSKLFLRIIHIWLIFTWVVVKIHDLLANYEKSFFKGRYIHIVVCVRRWLGTIASCLPICMEPIQLTWQIIFTNDFCSLGGQPLECHYFLVIKHKNKCSSHWQLWIW